MHGLALHGHALLLQMGDMPGMGDGPDPFSLFNHRLAGALVILLGVLALADATATGRWAWLRLLWPAPLLALGVYLLLRSDGPEWPPDIAAQLATSEGRQHKLLALLTLTLGGIELARRLGRLRRPAWPYVFDAVVLAAGGLLLLHGGHDSELVHRQHVGMAAVALGIGVGKVAADLMTDARWIAAGVLPVLFVALGVQLLLYTE